MKKAASVAIIIMLVLAMVASISGCKDKNPPVDEPVLVRPDPTPPTPTPPPEPPNPIANGGEVRVTGAVSYPFTPSSTGVWVFTTLDNGDSDPILTITGPGGTQVARDDDSADGFNAFIIRELRGGTTYTVQVDFYLDEPGSCTLKVMPAVTIPADGGQVRVNGSTGFVFTPKDSGTWEFRTSDNGNFDPTLMLLDIDGNLLSYDDDSSDGYNALIIYSLTAGTPYLIGATDYSNSNSSYSLTVSAINSIPSGGGSIRVDGESVYAFTPDQSGIWTIRTSESGGNDPMLTLYDALGNSIASDDDTDGYDAVIVYNMTAGVTYVIEVSFFSGASTTLSASFGASGSETDDMADSIVVEAPGEIFFSPDESGYWVFWTSDAGGADPTLAIYGPGGSLIQEDDDGWGDEYHALLSVILEAGQTYKIETGLYSGNPTTYTLNAKAPLLIPAAGGSADVINISGFTFRPEVSGAYEFLTSNNISSDPNITIYDSSGNLIGIDDDSGENYNARLVVNLSAGSSYYILVDFYQMPIGRCTLSVSAN